MKLIYRIKSFFVQLKRGFKFFLLGFRTYPWDYGFTKDILVYSLKEQLKLFESPDSVADWESNETNSKQALKALRLAIKLLELEEFESKDLPVLEHKWLEKENGMVQIVTLNSEADLVKFRELVQMGYRIDKKRQDIAYDIIKKYNSYWWD